MAASNLPEKPNGGREQVPEQGRLIYSQPRATFPHSLMWNIVQSKQLVSLHSLSLVRSLSPSIYHLLSSPRPPLRPSRPRRRRHSLSPRRSQRRWGFFSSMTQLRLICLQLIIVICYFVTGAAENAHFPRIFSPKISQTTQTLRWFYHNPPLRTGM